MQLIIRVSRAVRFFDVFFLWRTVCRFYDAGNILNRYSVSTGMWKSRNNKKEKQTKVLIFRVVVGKLADQWNV